MRPREVRKDSLSYPEADPWASPDLHKGHNHANVSPPKPNGVERPTSNGDTLPRTTSNFTTYSGDSPSNAPADNQTPASGASNAGGWGSFDPTPAQGFPNASGSGFDGAGGDEGDHPTSSGLGRLIGGGRVTGTSVEESIMITVLPEKEGMFMFQHRNYQVSSARRGSKVVRRYSDFVWLLDCLHKKYPFRQLPLLPPKRVAGKLVCFLLIRRSNADFIYSEWQSPILRFSIH
jgi:sorting nexin-8